MTAGPIPAASIHRHVNGWDVDEASLFTAVVRKMDYVYLTFEKDPVASAPLMEPENFDALFGNQR